MIFFLKLFLLNHPIRLSTGKKLYVSRTVIGEGAVVVHLNFRARSIFPFTVSNVPISMDKTSGAIRLTRSDFMHHILIYLLLLKGQRCVGRFSC